VRRAAVPLLTAVALSAALVQARSYDLWWHLETGRQILLHRAIPRVDDYSFTSAGNAWVDHSWLFQIVFYLVWLAAGAYGFTLLKAACALGVALIGYAVLARRGGSGDPGRLDGPAIALVSIALVGLRPRLGERPESLSLLMAAAAAALLLGLVLRPASPLPRLAALAGLTVLWTNLHAGALLAPALAGAMVAGAAAAVPGSADERRAERLAGLRNAAAGLAVTATGVLANPWGYRIFLVPARIAGALAPGNLTNPEWGRPSPGDFPLFFAAALLAAVAAIAGVVARRPSSLARAGLLALTIGLALTSVRHTGVFFALLPLAVDPDSLPAPATGRWRTAGLLVPVMAAAWMLYAPPAGAAIGAGVQPDRFPVKAADFIEARLPRARLYNDVAFGGYLIWRGYPERRVFIDGRNEVHADLLGEMSGAIDDGRKWHDLLARYAVEGAVVAYRSRLVQVRDAATGEVSDASFSGLHFPRREWALVWWDDVAMVFVRRDGPYGALASEREFRLCRPEAWLLSGVRVRSGEDRAAVAAELRRKTGEDPDCMLAKTALEVYGYGGPDATR